MRKFEKILEEIEKAKREPWYRLNNYDVKHKLDGAINRIVEIIRKNMSGKDTNVPTNNGWISVDDQLPEESGYYLTTHEDRMVVYHYSKRHKAFNSYDQFSDRDNLVTCLSVDAWQPLPEPYRPERRAQNGNQ